MAVSKPGERIVAVLGGSSHANRHRIVAFEPPGRPVRDDLASLRWESKRVGLATPTVIKLAFVKKLL
jgi:hypothetical protein